METTNKYMEPLNRFKVMTRKLRDESPYYPEYIVRSEYNPQLRSSDYYISTLLRLEHEGTWYDVHHVESYNVPDEILDRYSYDQVVLQMVRRLMRKVYLSILAYKIDPDFKRPDGEPLDEVSKIQRTEYERFTQNMQ